MKNSRKHYGQKSALAIAVAIALMETTQAGGFACPEGEVSETGELPCMSCELGTYQPNTGQTQCLDADPGFFVSMTGAVDQTACPPGRFQMLPGQAFCDAAPAGSFVSQAGAEMAVPCAVGTFQPDSGQTQCLDSGPGFFVPTTGATAQSECLAGSFQDLTGTSACKPAPPGRFVPENRAVEAFPCEPGRFQELEGQLACDTAPPGSFVSQAGADMAVPCAPGTFQPDSGQTECLDTGPGFFVSITGATAQSECLAGSFQDLTGTSACKLAPVGRFVAENRAIEATDCEPGRFQALEGQVACDAAPPGSFVSQAGAGMAVPCAPGTFQPDSGQTQCLGAAPGQFVAFSGASAAQDCPLGTFQPSPAQTDCRNSDPGFFVSNTGSTTAQQCPPGSVSFVASPACRQAPTPGANVVSPQFNSSLGRGGEPTLARVLSAPQDRLALELRNTATDIGQASPLTQLTLRELVGSTDVTAPEFPPGSTLDEGETLSVELELTASALGQLRFPFQVSTDEGAAPGDEGRRFDFTVSAPVDGNDVSVSAYADRLTTSNLTDFGLRLTLSNPGRAQAPNNQLSFQISPDTLCQFNLSADPGTLADATSLSQTGADTVFLPARASVDYIGTCRSSASAPEQIQFTASVDPDPTLGDVDNLNNSDTGVITLSDANQGEAELSVSVLSRSDFLAPDSIQQVVYEITNRGPDPLLDGSFTVLVNGLADLLDLICADQPASACGTLRRAGRNSFAVDTQLDLAVGESRQITLNLRVRTLEAQTIEIAAIAAAPAGWVQPSGSAGQSEIRLSGGIFNDGFE